VNNQFHIRVREWLAKIPRKQLIATLVVTVMAISIFLTIAAPGPINVIAFMIAFFCPMIAGAIFWRRH
jgi:hypothetical protein